MPLLHAPLSPTLKRGHEALKLVCGRHICLLLLWLLILKLCGESPFDLENKLTFSS